MANPPIIYGTGGRASRVQWLLREIGGDAANIKIDTRFKPNPGKGMAGDPSLSEELKKLNPNVRIPILKDGDFVLTESCAIHMYLAKKYGSPMAPRDLQEEALMNQFSFWVMTELEQDSLILMFTDGLGRAGGHPEWQNRGGPEQVQKNLNRALDALEAWLSDGRSFLVGDRFTVADFNVVSVFEWLLRGKFDLSKHHPHVKKYVEMHLARQEQSKM